MQSDEILGHSNNSEQSFRKLLDLTPVGIILTDKDGNCSYVNQQWMKIAGIDFSEALGMGWTKIIHPDDLQRVINTWNSHSKVEFRIKQSTGIVTWVQSQTETLLDESKNIIGFITTMSDINELKQTADNLRRSESRYRSIVTHSPVCIHEINLQGEITSMNQAGLSMMHVNSESAVRGLSYLAFVSSEDRKRIEELLCKAFAGETSVFEFKASGTPEKVFKSCFAPVKNSEGEVLWLMGITEDITELKKHEVVLKENEQRLRLATASAKLGIWDLDLKHNILKWDDRMMELYGINRKEFGSAVEVWQNALHPDDKAAAFEAYQAALSGEKNFNTEFRIVCPDGTVKTMHGTALIIRDSHGRPIRMTGVNRDITEEKKTLERLYQLNSYLQTAREEAEQATLMKSRFLDIAAHELRTPVAAFSLLLQFTQKKLARGIPVDAATLIRLEKQVDRITRLVIDLLDVSRLERGVMNLNFKLTDVVSLVSDCLEEFRLSKPERKFIFLAPETAIPMKIDPVRIYQVISNLLDNACKYSPENSSIEVTIEVTPQLLRISIKDFGPGILEIHKAALFTPFSRLSEELTDKSGGLGLGLFICRSIVELHGGMIDLESKLGVGTKFFFELPREGSLR